MLQEINQVSINYLHGGSYPNYPLPRQNLDHSTHATNLSGLLQPLPDPPYMGLVPTRAPPRRVVHQSI